MITRIFLAAGAALALGACSTIQALNLPKDFNPPPLPPPQEIAEAQSAISVIGDSSAIVRRTRRDLPDRYQEWLSVRGGTFFYERFYGVDPDVLSEVVYRDQFFGGDQAKSKIVDPRIAVTANGIVHFVVDEQGGQRCITFQQYIGPVSPVSDTTVGPEINREYIRGNRCGGSESETLDLLGRLRFDRGLRNEARAFQTLGQPQGQYQGQMRTGARQAAPGYTPASAPLTRVASGQGGGALLASAAAGSELSAQLAQGAPPRPWNQGTEQATPVATRAPANDDADRPSSADISFAAVWESVNGQMTGALKPNGTLALTLPYGASTCTGAWTMSTPATHGAIGAWSLYCDNGRTAFGAFRPGQDGGDGRDTSGHRVSFSFAR